MVADIQRFWSRVDQSGGVDACWPWITGRFTNGYGCFRADMRNQRAHRWLLGYLRGKPLGFGEMACHHCDNPPCCNPAHLFVGTAKDNAQDMVAKGRSAQQKKDHCPQGHPYSPENTYFSNEGRLRKCRTCTLERMKIPGAVAGKDRTHCAHGHAYDLENTYVDNSGHRHCRACGRENARKRRQRARVSAG